MRILVIEDHAMVREGLLLALGSLAINGSGIDAIGVHNAEAANAVLAENDSFDLLLLDLMLPGIGGMAYLGVLRKLHPRIPVVILSALDDADTVRKALQQGAAGFVPKSSPTDVLLGAVREVLAGGVWLPPEYRDTPPSKRRRARTPAERYGLTRSQARVLELLAEGKTNRDIAGLLDVTEGTVKIHVSAILKALNVSNRSQALLVAQGKR